MDSFKADLHADLSNIAVLDGAEPSMDGNLNCIYIYCTWNLRAIRCKCHSFQIYIYYCKWILKFQIEALFMVAIVLIIANKVKWTP